MPRVTADTNIYISALNFGGMSERLLLLADAGAVQLITSEAILDEVRRVLRGKKFAWPEEQVGRALHQLARLTECVTPTHTLSVVTADPTDNRILECADAGRADYIVSGDAHLVNLKQHGGIPILKVADFLKQLQEQFSLPR